jgi:membrane-associated phospholipid phosphatase
MNNICALTLTAGLWASSKLQTLFIDRPLCGFQVPLDTILQNVQKRAASLDPTDKLLITFWGLLAALSAILFSRIPSWLFIFSADLTAMLLLCALAFIANSKRGNRLRWIHDWAAFPLVIFTFKQLYFIISPIHHGKSYDSLLIAIDHLFFGANPTEWLARFSNPILTEALQISYSLFYVFFIAIGLELYFKKDRSGFEYFKFTMVYGFFISYVAYFIFPAVGPRFTLHDFSKLDAELPGLIITPSLRWFVNIFESIHAGMPNSIALVSAQRDVFPSGHTMMTLAAIAFAWKFGLRIRYCILIIGILLIFATVYLRYHYFVDVLAGALLAILCLLTSRALYLRLRK